MSLGACPGDETFAGFLAGLLAPSERDQLVDHVDSCSRCAELIASPASALSLPKSGRIVGAVVATFRSGAVLAGRYKVNRLLGAGGMGEVYEAFDLSLNEPVALKTVRATIADDPRAIDRLKSEVLLARRVTHPNVCRIFDFGIHHAEGRDGDAVPFLTMELLAGGTLARRILERRPFTHAQVVDVAHQLAVGLSAAHKVNVIHKDLKAENVMLVEPTGQPVRAVITDFGLAASRVLTEIRGEAHMRFSGTPGYVAPERMNGAPATEASDVFSLGVVILDILKAAPPAPRSALAVLALRCRATDPAARPPLPEVLRALQRMQRPPAAARWRAAGVAAAALIAIGLVVGLKVARQPSEPAIARRAPVAAPAAAPAIPAAAAPAAAAPSAARVPEAAHEVPRAEPPAAPPPPARKRKMTAMPKPKDDPAAELLATAEERLGLGRLQEACALGQVAARRAPQAPAVWEFLGRCYMRLAEPDEARGYYRKYLELAPDAPQASFVRAIVEPGRP